MKSFTSCAGIRPPIRWVVFVLGRASWEALYQHTVSTISWRGTVFMKVKVVELKTGHCILSSAELKNVWAF